MKNKGFPNEPDVGYRNFFIQNPRDEKISIPNINGHSENLLIHDFFMRQTSAETEASETW